MINFDNAATAGWRPDEVIEAGDTLVALGPTHAVEGIERASH